MASLPFRLVTCSISGQFWWPVAERHWLYNCVCLSLPHVRNWLVPSSELPAIFPASQLLNFGRFWWPVAERHWLYNCFWWPVAERHWLYDCVCLSLPHVRNGWYPAQNCELFFLSGG
ncbi:hypothetical protein B0H14DRAFT_2557548 [Mycena olivaceomarginata]|nr:hypothetical protein B0H14DRAFT_2557548 [Mycena olivaceomarginata]